MSAADDDAGHGGEVVPITGLMRAQFNARRGLPPPLAPGATSPDLTTVRALLLGRFEAVRADCEHLYAEIADHTGALTICGEALAANVRKLIEIKRAFEMLPPDGAGPGDPAA